MLYEVITLKAFDNANNGDYSDITRIYNSFFNHFMNNNIIGDIFIKKQGYISYHTDTNSIAGKIAMAVNNTYSPVITNNKYYNTSNIYMPNKIDMLTIFGELDIVSRITSYNVCYTKLLRIGFDLFNRLYHFARSGLAGLFCF